jgi:hypothetical protein
MDEEYPEAAEVLSGTLGNGLRWVVLAWGSDDNFFTMLHVYKGGRKLAGSGFGGPKVPTSSVMNEWRGKTDGLPYFVMARVLPAVDRIVATTDRGSEIPLAMSPVIERFGLRFAAAPLPDGERPGSLRAETASTVLDIRAQPMPPFPGHPDGSAF